ncbi:hypothetical protein ACTGW8_12695, partial [Streptococcus suis]
MPRYSRSATLILGSAIILLGTLMATNIPGLSLVLSYWPAGLVVLRLSMIALERDTATGLIIAIVGLQVLS